MSEMMIYDYLHRNGVIIERARRAIQSLTLIERNIILCARRFATDRGATRQQINAMEMEGERDWGQVLSPLKVKIVFAYFDEGYEDIPPLANYYVRESNHPGLPAGSHVCVDQIIEAGQKIPKTPTYDQWVKDGKKVVRK